MITQLPMEAKEQKTIGTVLSPFSAVIIPTYLTQTDGRKLPVGSRTDRQSTQHCKAGNKFN